MKRCGRRNKWSERQKIWSCDVWMRKDGSCHDGILELIDYLEEILCMKGLL